MTGKVEAALCRNAAIDLLRAGCILYIVGYWHLVPYTQAFPGYANIYTECIKDIALGTFVFCSGLLLASRPVALTWSGLPAFYLRRVMRIYPLYVIALLGFSVAGLAGTSVIIDALLLVSMFFPPAPYTVWFISMIMTFYLCAPFWLRLADYPRTYFLAGVLTLGLGVLVHAGLHQIDTRILQYLPCFLLGISWKRMPALACVCRCRMTLFVALLLPAFLLYRLQNGEGMEAALGRIPAILAGVVLLYLTVTRRSDYLQSPLVSHLAYASFCVYLFHRLVFHYSIGLYFPEDSYQRLVYLLGVVLPVTVVVSFYMQRLYDRAQRFL